MPDGVVELSVLDDVAAVPEENAVTAWTMPAVAGSSMSG